MRKCLTFALSSVLICPGATRCDQEVAAIAKATDMRKADVETVLDAFFDYVGDESKRGDKVGWPCFGNFSASQRAARTGRNPQTGEPVQIAASTAMKFSASKALKEKLNG